MIHEVFTWDDIAPMMTFKINDTHTIISAGNLLNTEVETPRQDANVGLVMSTDKDGISVSNHVNTGLYLPNEVKSLKKIKVKGEEMFLVVRNNDALELWRMW